jgi:hypothetical protein
MRLITIILPIDPRINCKDKERVESLYKNVVIIFSNERPYISNGDEQMIVNIAHMLVNPVRL